jgi:hypothetical protein
VTLLRRYPLATFFVLAFALTTARRASSCPATRRGQGGGVRGTPLPSVHTRRSHVARHDRRRHLRVLEAANLTSISYPTFYPNLPQHHPTQTDTPPRGSSGNPHP